MTWNLHLTNVAGIREGEAEFHPGVNAVRAANWQGKSSLLRGVETVMGTRTPLTEGEREGRAVLSTPEGEIEIELTRRNGSVVRSGEPYLESEGLRVRASLYAFLDETNEVRRAVRNGTDLAEVLTRPLEFEDIDAKIAARKDERRRVERELDRAEEAAEELPSVQSELTVIESELDDLTAKRDELDGDATEADETRERLTEARAERDRAASRAKRLENAIERTEATLEDRRAEREALTVPDVDVESDLADRRAELSAARRDLDLLQSIYSANKRLVEEGRLDLVADVERGLVEDTAQCWVCGADATVEAFEKRIEGLGQRVSELRTTVAEHEQRVEELETERREVTEAKRRQRDLDEEITDLETNLADREESLERATERIDDLDEEIDSLSATVVAEDERLTDIESEIKLLAARHEETAERRDELEATANKRSTLAEERDSLTAEIERLRNRKDELERRTRSAFDEAITELVPQFETSFETARLTADFDLVVARDGREASLDALSEGELELLGIVAALAGHEAFDVAEDVPVLLLDGLGALSDENLRILVEYLHERTPYLVFTAYPENGAFDAHEIDPTEWRVVSTDAKRERTQPRQA